MSVTILIRKKAPEVAIVRWYRDPKYSVAYPSGPLVTLSMDDFRSNGQRLIMSYLEEYGRLRMEEQDAVPVFEADEQKAFLKQSIPVGVFSDPQGNLVFSPLKFRSYELAGLKSQGSEAFQKIPLSADKGAFWEAFEAALADAG